MPPKSKHKTYRIHANRHYIFIQNPWPFDFSVSTARYPTAYVNAVVAWICCMVRDLCDTDIDESNVRIFYQCTHRDIIAEIELASLPSLAPLLGAHHSFKFLTPKHVGDANHTSVVYEYNYERFNSPYRTNWTAQMATYAYFPPDLGIKSWHKNEGLGFSYPAPSPSDAKRPQTARPLPGRLILGHPDCPPQNAAPQAPAQPTEPGMTATPPLQSAVTEAKTAQSTPGVPTTNECLAPDASLHIPQPLGDNSPSEFAFTPYVPPMHFPCACSGSMPAATQPQPSKTYTKRDPYEEDTPLERLKGAHVAFADAQVKSEVTTEGVLNVHVQRQDTQARNAESTRIKMERGDGDLRSKTEDVKKEVTYSASTLLREVYAQGQAEMRARIAENMRPTETTLSNRHSIS
ncbi:hypothetical protein C8R47DRAFT_1125490 [Mycena vitilis]|nr:hypothetical protein C8R47DRAFT_1125490 [Mycena vitilis]